MPVVFKEFLRGVISSVVPASGIGKDIPQDFGGTYVDDWKAIGDIVNNIGRTNQSDKYENNESESSKRK
ncbi:MAG: hypothetical protein LBI29_00755 [Rickettsiales bacterium]|jgi:hypothetical protein|nr:hypothetical protein [Rickettsiales bacterium]